MSEYLSLRERDRLDRERLDEEHRLAVESMRVGMLGIGVFVVMFGVFIWRVRTENPSGRIFRRF